MSLTSKETRLLSRRLGRKCRILGSGVSQLFFANPGCEPRDSRNPVLRSFKFKSVPMNQWVFTEVFGALLLVDDRELKSLYFKLFDLDKFELRFQHEIYYGCKLFRIAPNFLCFEMEDALCGFNFSSKEVAAAFHNVALGLSKRETNETSGTVKKGGRKRHRSSGETRMKRAQGLEPGRLDIEEMPKEWKRLLREAGFGRADLKNPSLQDDIIEVLREHNIEVGEPELSMEEAKNILPPKHLRAYSAYVEEVKVYEKQISEDDAKEGYSVYDREVLKGLKKWERDFPRRKPPTGHERFTPAPVPQPKKVIRKKRKPFPPALQLNVENLQKVKLRQNMRGNVKSRLPRLHHLSQQVKSTISVRLKQRLQARRKDLSVEWDDSGSDDSWLSE